MAGMLAIKGVAPPPSRKLTDTPDIPPWFVEANPPSKYGSKSTLVPFQVPAVRIPGTAIPTFGLVSMI